MKKVLVAVLSLVMLCSACSTAWVSTLDAILAAAVPSLINILQIVAIAKGLPADADLAAKINADSAVIKTLANDFAKASSTSAPGVCRQLKSAVGTYEADQQLVLQVAQVSDPNTQTKITLLANLVGGTVEAITAVIPSCQDSEAARAFKAAPPYNLTTFSEQYNSILIAPTGNAAVDAATPKMQLHRHSKLARLLTLGLLQ